MQNVNISKYYKNMSYDSEDIIKLQGLYEEKYSDTGGPFVAYVKYNKNNTEATIVSGFVNNPGKEKLRLLKELDVQFKKIIYKEKYEK